MRIGIVCPYSFDAPGGVQVHIRDLTEELVRRGHFVRVLAPATGDDLPSWLAPVGSSFAVPFNGSVARLAFSPKVARLTKRWLEQGNFDVVHIHEPGVPSVGLLALMQTDVPVVATFHSAMEKSKLRVATAGLVKPFLDRIAARVAVSSEALRTLQEHHGGDATIIPNGVFTKNFAAITPNPDWAATKTRPVFVFLGRLNEPRKGLHVFLGAIDEVLANHPEFRLLIAGRGDASQVDQYASKYPDSVEFLGDVDDEEKASLFAGATAYIAPQTGGESFGIVLVEAMAAGTLVIASDIAAFAAVLDDGKAGDLFAVGDSSALARAIVGTIEDPDRATALAKAGKERAEMYDWATVTDQLLAVYQSVLPTASPVAEEAQG